MTQSTTAKSVGTMRPAMLAAGLLTVFYALVMTFIGPELVIAKLHDDSLIYFSQALQLAHGGSTSGFTYGEGLKPITFAPVSAYARFPIFLMFRDFDSIIRAIQIQNILFLVSLGMLSWRYLTIRLPVSAFRSWTFVPFAMLAISYTPWFSNAYLPLSDHIFALLTISFVLLCLDYEWWMRSRVRQLLWGVLLLAILIISCVQKITAIAIIAYMILFFVKRRQFSRRQIIIALSATSIFIVAMAIAERDLYRFYISTALNYSIRDRSFGNLITDSIMNFFLSALPSQIIPDFNFTFLHRSDLSLGLRLADVNLLWLPFALLGAAISSVVVLGGWTGRRTLAPELAVILLTAPFYALIVNGGGTIRYLAYMQPFFLVLFVTGLQAVRSQFVTRHAPSPALLFGIAGLVLVGMAGVSASTMAAPLRQALLASNFLSNLGHSFAAERRVVASLPSSHLRFVNIVEGGARWYAVANVRYVDPELVPALLCRGYAIYWVFDCDRRNCAAAHVQESMSRKRLDKAGAFQMITIYQDQSVAADITIQRILPRAAACGAGLSQPGRP